MDLRDKLAVTRTVLANQRTLLTFFNASLALLITGLTLIKFFSESILYWVGLIFLPGSIILFFYGLQNYVRHKNKIKTSYEIG